MRCAYKILHNLRKIYWRIFAPVTVGVRAVIVNPANEILLVRHSYLQGWYLPGGKADRKESLTECL